MGKKILIVDDSPIARRIIQSHVPKDKDHEVRLAKDGADGLEQFKEFWPDITFLDLTMPVMDGFQALEEMRKVNPKAIIIIVSADVQAVTLKRVMAAGALCIVQKPPKPDEIEKFINNIG